MVDLLNHNFADLSNATFEGIGSLFILKSVKRLYRDKLVRGIAWQQVGFWSAWGWWNLYYYWAINSPLSWRAGVLCTSVNTIYLSLLIYYTRQEKPHGQAH